MNICNHPLSLFDLSPDILESIINQVKLIKLHKELNWRWSLYGSVCNFSKPSNRCDCESICSSGGGPGWHFHPGRNLLNLLDQNNPLSQWSLSSYRIRWQSLRNRRFSYRYYIAGIELSPSISYHKNERFGPSMKITKPLHYFYEICKRKGWNKYENLKNNEFIRFLMKKEEEEINKFI
tara:strand:- start:75 stop:611 length:537 start_codon:yes stop_codon:yes gene_type:complete